MQFAQEQKVVLADEVLEVFIDLMESVRDNKFEIGDRINDLVELHNGNKKGVIDQLAGKLNVRASTLYDYASTSERWTPAYRQIYQSLDYTIYRNSDPVEDAELLNSAIDNGWNSSTFKNAKYPALCNPKTMIGQVLGLLEKIKSREPNKNNQLAIDNLIREVSALAEIWKDRA